MSLPQLLRDGLRLPVVGAPMFIVSGPELVLAQCKAGIVGSFRAQRPPTGFSRGMVDAHRRRTGGIPRR
jgi:NAD(P)H-dependent flavin oxidoreductase YrpB (nitropropane dioxygenase family)